jgi:hypothetical protein
MLILTTNHFIYFMSIHNLHKTKLQFKFEISYKSNPWGELSDDIEIIPDESFSDIGTLEAKEAKPNIVNEKACRTCFSLPEDATEIELFTAWKASEIKLMRGIEGLDGYNATEDLTALRKAKNERYAKLFADGHFVEKPKPIPENPTEQELYNQFRSWKRGFSQRIKRSHN